MKKATCIASCFQCCLVDLFKIAVSVKKCFWNWHGFNGFETQHNYYSIVAVGSSYQLLKYFS